MLGGRVRALGRSRAVVSSSTPSPRSAAVPRRARAPCLSVAATPRTFTASVRSSASRSRSIVLAPRRDDAGVRDDDVEPAEPGVPSRRRPRSTSSSSVTSAASDIHPAGTGPSRGRQRLRTHQRRERARYRGAEAPCASGDQSDAAVEQAREGSVTGGARRRSVRRLVSCCARLRSYARHVVAQRSGR